MMLRARNLSSRLRSAALLRGHRYTYDLWVQRGEKHATDKIAWKEELHVPDEYRQHSTEYAPTPGLCVQLALKGLEVDLNQYAFVDVGSGRGRVLRLACEYPFRQVLGIEMDQSLARQAEENILSLPKVRHRAGHSQAIAGNALDCTLPDMPTIFYLFNPFDEDVTAAFLRRLQARTSHVSKDIILFLNLKYSKLLDQHGYRQLDPKPLPGLLLKALSPYPLQAYAKCVPC